MKGIIRFFRIYEIIRNFLETDFIQYMIFEHLKLPFATEM